MAAELSEKDLALIDAYWRAANYLSVGQIYLFDNPLLKEPLTEEHVKPRLLGHWGTTPGLNFIYAHLNRVIKERDLDMIYVTGPGHGGPGLVANTYLEGTYSEVYPNISQDEHGMKRLFTQFSFPGGIPSHVAPETPGSIHEGGELGYALSHAYGAAFDNPDLIVACVVGDGEAETGPLATSWHSNKFLNPVRDGAVLPILHLNGYKIANPTVLARIPHEELDHLFRGYGYTPYFVEGDDPKTMHKLMAATIETVVDDIRAIQKKARSKRIHRASRLADDRAAHAQGLDRPEGDRRQARPRATGARIRCRWARCTAIRSTSRILEEWMKSYRPQELFDEHGRLKPELAALAPSGERRMSANPHANGGVLLRDLRLPDFRDYAVEVTSPGAATAEATRVMGDLSARRDEAQHGVAEFPPVQSGREQFQPLAGRARSDEPHLGGRDASLRRSSRARRTGHGDAERAPVPGLARRLSADRAARVLLVLRSLHPHHRLHVQPARQMAEGVQRHRMAPADRLAQLPPVEPCVAAGSQRLLASGSRLHRPRGQQEGGGRARLSAAGRELPAVGH